MAYKSKFKYIFTQLIAIIFIAIYLTWGTYLYYVLEKNEYIKLCYEGKQQDDLSRLNLRNTIVNYLKSNLTESGNITEAMLYVEQNIIDYRSFVLSNRGSTFYIGQDCLNQSNWNIPNILLFVLTIITSIGYDKGKLSLIVYATLGIPLFLVFLRNLSECLGNLFRHFFFRIILRFFTGKKTKKHINGNEITEETEDINEKGVPLTVTLVIITLYLIIGGFIFNSFENWQFVAAVYFSYISLSTIGFGDLVPGQNLTDPDRNIKLVFGIAYILFGLGVLAMSFDLVERELIEKFIWLGKMIGLIKHEDVDDNDDDDDDNHVIVEHKAENNKK